MKFSVKNEDKNIKKTSRLLLNWYRENKRNLPWRETKDPYAILVSEVMLQQTQVKTVIPYFLKWMSRWPDWASLAASREEEVVKLWEGLGYYSRARALRAIAQLLVRNGVSFLPRDIKELRKLPGVGEYTAGAVASIAYGVRTAAIDGNVRRVISRLAGVDQNSKSRTLQHQIREILDRMLPEEGSLCGDFNQALMELGALICRPREPLCGCCPWKKMCVSYNLKDGNPLSDNTGKASRKNIRRTERWAWIERKGRLWCKAPSESRLLQGLWTLPQFDPENMHELERLGEIKFSISTRRVHAKIVRCDWKSHKTDPSGGSWLSIEEINQRPFSAASRRFMEKMGWTVRAVTSSINRYGSE